MEIDIIRKGRRRQTCADFRREVYWDGIQQSQVIYNDITERKQAEKQKTCLCGCCRYFNQSGEKKELISSLLELFKEDGRYEAVGIRLRNGDDYPYYQTDGFTEEHIKEENRLCQESMTMANRRATAGIIRYYSACAEILFYRRSGIFKTLFHRRRKFLDKTAQTDFLAAAGRG